MKRRVELTSGIERVQYSGPDERTIAEILAHLSGMVSGCIPFTGLYSVAIKVKKVVGYTFGDRKTNVKSWGQRTVMFRGVEESVW